jgi:hypothetical protein
MSKFIAAAQDCKKKFMVPCAMCSLTYVELKVTVFAEASSIEKEASCILASLLSVPVSWRS